MTCLVKSQLQGALLILRIWVYGLWVSSWTWQEFVLFLWTLRILHFSGWNDIPHLLSISHSVWGSSWRIWQSLSDRISLYTTRSSANSWELDLTLTGRSLMTTRKSTGPKTFPWGHLSWRVLAPMQLHPLWFFVDMLTLSFSPEVFLGFHRYPTS